MSANSATHNRNLLPERVNETLITTITTTTICYHHLKSSRVERAGVFVKAIQAATEENWVHTQYHLFCNTSWSAPYTLRVQTSAPHSSGCNVDRSDIRCHFGCRWVRRGVTFISAVSSALLRFRADWRCCLHLISNLRKVFLTSSQLTWCGACCDKPTSYSTQ